MKTNIFEKIILIVVMVLNIVMAAVQWGLTTKRSAQWTYCWQSTNDIAASCALPNQTVGSTKYITPAGNAAIYWLLAQGILIAIGMALKGCHYWFDSRKKSRDLAGRT